jgi:hypothetical protein
MDSILVVKQAKVHIQKSDITVMLSFTSNTCTVLFIRSFSRRFHRSINQSNRYSTAQLMTFGKKNDEC